MSLYSIVSEFSDRVNDGRDNFDIFNHGAGEMKELQTELTLKEYEDESGPDGILGEAIDVIACMMDLIRKNYPAVTDVELEAVMLRKCEKWQRKTEAGEYVNR